MGPINVNTARKKHIFNYIDIKFDELLSNNKEDIVKNGYHKGSLLNERDEVNMIKEKQENYSSL